MFRTVPLSIIRRFHCTHSDRICHTGLLTACEQDQDGTSSILILLASCPDQCTWAAASSSARQKHFTRPEGQLPLSHRRTCPYHQPDKSRPRSPSCSFKIDVNIIIQYIPTSSKWWSLSPSGFRTKTLKALHPLPHTIPSAFLSV